MELRTVFSEFSQGDWWRLGMGLVVPALLALFAAPIASALGTAQSAPLLFASVILFIALTNVAAFLARGRLSGRAKLLIPRVASVAILLLAVIYFFARSDLAAYLDLPPRAVDAAMVLVLVVVVMRLAEFASERGDGAEGE